MTSSSMRASDAIRAGQRTARPTNSDPRDGRVTFELRNGSGHSIWVLYRGGWLVPPEPVAGETDDPTAPPGLLFGVALLRSGRFLIYRTTRGQDGPATMRIVDSLADADLPLDITQVARLAHLAIAIDHGPRERSS